MTRAFLALVSLLLIIPVAPADIILDEKLHHLRSKPEREWAEFPEKAEAAELTLTFDSKANTSEKALRLRHRDVKQLWRILLNAKEIARLPQDEADTITYWALPPGALKDGRNDLRIHCPGGASDDVMIGQVTLIDRPRADALSEATVEVTVFEEPAATPLPCRITIADANGTLISTGNTSGPDHAVRPGILYCRDGKVQLKLPAGKYTMYAGRGFEYSLATAQLDLAPGTSLSQKLSIRREVDTRGYAAMDTHVHTATFARHGDATIEERMLTIAGEGVELPASTEHNMLVDFDSHARKAGVRAHFTPLLGSEVTTPAIGHFNVFPIAIDAKAINQRAPDWNLLAGAIAAASDDPVIILNHGRDVHGGFRPLDSSRHISLTGENLDGWKLPANAMEVINSGAVLGDSMLLLRDWMGMLNRGIRLTPVGSSDSHDISRYIVGQGRTYVRCNDADPGNIDLAEVTRSVRQGKVLVSYGLIAEVGFGQVFPFPDKFAVRVCVKGPSWSKADRVALYMNGSKVHEEVIQTPDRAGVKYEALWPVSRPRADVHFVAIAIGPGITAPHWPTAKPYQPTGIEFTPYTFGASAAEFVDIDGNGVFDSAFDYAQKAVAAAKDPADLARRLNAYDSAVAAQAASILRAKDPANFESTLATLLKLTNEEPSRGLRMYLESWKQSAEARKSLP